MEDCGNGIYLVDAHYEHEEIAAIYILRSEGRAAIIETANNASLPYLLEAMKELGMAREEIDYVCVTHVHLDHAGGAGSYMREFPNAKLVVHPRGVRHMVDPTDLVKSVCGVYGESETARLYGHVVPVPRERIIPAEDGLEISFGAMTLVCYDAPGHAKHHIILLEKSTGTLFSGEAFGVSYRWMRGSGGQWACPAIAPVQFDPEVMTATMKMILSLAPSRIFPTHFGELTDIGKNAELIISMIKDFAAITEEEHGDKERIKRRLFKYFTDLINEKCAPAPPVPAEELLVDLELNAQGLAVWYAKKHGQ